MQVLTQDMIKHLAAVVEWLKSAPIANVSYGEFYVSNVPVYFDSYEIGTFVDVDQMWEFRPNESYWSAQ